MTDPITETLDELERLAKEATPGPWAAQTWSVECEGEDGYSCDGGCTACDGEGELTQEAIKDTNDAAIAGVGTANLDGKPVGKHIQLYGLEDFAKKDGSFIAALNPSRALELIAVVRAAKRLVDAKGGDMVEMFEARKAIRRGLAKLGGGTDG